MSGLLGDIRRSTDEGKVLLDWNDDSWDNWDSNTPKPDRHVLEVEHPPQGQMGTQRSSNNARMRSKCFVGCLIVTVAISVVMLWTTNIFATKDPVQEPVWDLTLDDTDLTDASANIPEPASANIPEPSSNSSSRLSCTSDVEELLHAFVPESYLLTFDLEKPTVPLAAGETETFRGHAHILGRMAEDSTCIALHSKNLTVYNITIGGSCLCGCNDVNCSEIVHEDTKREIIMVSTTVGKGNVSVDISYEGHYGDGYGLYKSEPFMGKEQSEVLSVTQLETKGARQVWPGVDLPSAKANFSVVLHVPLHVPALSNMPLSSKSAVVVRGKEVSRLEFETSPKMSSYLLALAVGSLRSKSSLMASGQNVTVWSTVNHEEEVLNLAMEASVSALDFYQDYTDFQLPLRKFDLVAVPGKSGAMENFGLLLFDEDRFLFDSKKESAYGKLEAMNVICHEVAHQWFGDLVTCESWKDIATNEGFASFFEYKCMGAMMQDELDLFEVMGMPTWKKAGVHFPGARQHALSIDVSSSSPIISNSVNFDGITYSKGASIVKMLEEYAESKIPGSFQVGIRKCLKEKAYSTITFNDYLGCISVGTDLTATFSDWLYKSGYPLLEVNVDAQGNFNFIQLNYSTSISNENDLGLSNWTIPVSVRAFGREETYTSLVGTDGSLSGVGEGSEPLPAILNYGANGYYRVQYNRTFYQELADNLVANIEKMELDSKGRVTLSSIVSDLFELSNVGIVDVEVALEFIEKIATPSVIKDKSKYTVLVPILSSLEDWYMRLRSLPCSKDVSNFIKRIDDGFLDTDQVQNSTNTLEELADMHIFSSAASHGSLSAVNSICNYFNSSQGNEEADDDVDGIDKLGSEPIAYIGRAQVQCDQGENESQVLQILHDCLTEGNTEEQVCFYAWSQLRNVTLLEGLFHDALNLQVHHMSLSKKNAEMILKGLIRNHAMSIFMPGLVSENYINLKKICKDCAKEAIQYNPENSTFKTWLESPNEIPPEDRKTLQAAYSDSEKWSKTTGSRICTWLN